MDTNERELVLKEEVFSENVFLFLFDYVGNLLSAVSGSGFSAWMSGCRIRSGMTIWATGNDIKSIRK